MIERIIYECEHCHRRKLMNKIKMKEHEEQCWYNIKNETCVTCLYNDFDGVKNTCGINNFENKKPVINCIKWENSDPDYEEDED